ncbi:MAG: HD domain-containing protein, partial [Armatimonadetes bacterium]|nr:HD domain-containing protein [Armatimonadota bacterium]
SMILARGLGLDASASVELGVSAMLHDVGKVFIPDEIVKKPGKLTEEDWEQVRRHPIAGARALAATPGLPSLASTIALEHHAYCDGTGYPAFALDRRPHLLSRLVAIVDTYDALTTDRPYRERWTGQQAVAWMLYEAPNRYDRLLMAKFAAQSGMLPIGAMVRLANGEIGVVTAGSRKHPTKPTVKLVSRRDAQGTAKVINLAQSEDPAHEIQALAQPVEALLPYADLLAA